ncbi:MAG: response regulator transcription factor [Proteobacteria bacterium]|nr:MAG: response regulator transcription factor [Pseudomonadota bacterium]
MRRRVLVIEDERPVARFLKASLESADYDVRTEENGARGIQVAIEFRPDLLILDLGLPDLDGIEVLTRLRQWMTAPILILTARETDDDKVRALDLGADDYLTKPFSLAELQARMRVALRHCERGGNHSQIYKNGSLICDLEGHVVQVNGHTLKLTATEYDILKILIRLNGRVVTHRALLKEIWGPNSVEHTQYLRVYVGQLRKKLRAHDPDQDFIQTDPGVGYRFMTMQEDDA